MNSFRLNRRKNICFLIVIIFILIILGGVVISKYGLTITSYEVMTSKLSTSLKIAQITDLHNAEFGSDNKRLLRNTKEQSPDIILVTGDLLNSDDTTTDIAKNVLRQLCEIAPVYVSLGNHEVEHSEKYGTDIMSLYESAGATVLDKQYEDITINDQKLRLGGIYGYCLSDKYLKTGEANEEECAFLTDFQNTDRYTVLMCHMPVCWIENNGVNEWEVDLILAGHAHGGQIRIPFVGGLWAPDQGWFPGKEGGLYYASDGSKVMVLSRGLGSSEIIPRFNNIPEIVIVDLIPK